MLNRPLKRPPSISLSGTRPVNGYYKGSSSSFFCSPSPSPPRRRKNETEQKSISSCYAWLKILVGAAMLVGSVILLVFFPYSLIPPFLKVVTGFSVLIGAGLFYKGCRENKELQKEIRNSSYTNQR